LMWKWNKNMFDLTFVRSNYKSRFY
jgi:hypothetical protein